MFLASFGLLVLEGALGILHWQSVDETTVVRVGTLGESLGV